MEGPFGEFSGHYSGGRYMKTVVRIDKVSYRHQAVSKRCTSSRGGRGIDYLMGPATCVPL
ncbi:UbiD family decarboxylase domain-containing protein [Escherichia coli]